MLLSAEVRLFWFDEKPSALETWFKDESVHHCPAGGGKLRTDVYLRDANQTELGVKTRGEKSGVEVKGLVALPGDTLEFNSCEIPLELWSKWPSQKLAFDMKAGVVFRKRRWLRMFDTTKAQPIEIALDSDEQPAHGETLPQKGCNVEWTIVEIPSGEACWTLGFEAYGGLQNVENSLRSVVRVMNERNPPPAPGAKALSYLALIQQLPRTLTAPTPGD